MKSGLRINGVVETILYSERLAETTAFFREVLGLAVIGGDGVRFRALDAGEGRVLLLFRTGATREPVAVTGGVIPPHDGAGPQHIGLGIAAADYDGWKARLAAHGVAIESEARWERGGRSLYFRDPDGHLVELVTPGIWPTY